MGNALNKISTEDGCTAENTKRASKQKLGPVKWNSETNKCDPMSFDVMNIVYNCNPGESYSVDDNSCSVSGVDPTSACTSDQVFNIETQLCEDKPDPQLICLKYWDTANSTCIDYTEDTCTSDGGVWDADNGCGAAESFTNKFQNMTNKDFFFLIVIVFLIMYMTNNKFKKSVNKMVRF